MNIKELQIGDYFRVAKDNLCISKGTVVEIRGIDADNSFEEKNLKGCASCRPLDKYQFNGGIWVEHLEPIPLSAELLEKNGWRKINKNENSHVDGAYSWGDMGKRNFTDVTITFYKDLSGGVKILTKIETDCSHEIGINTVHNCDIEYVHQFQHAMRLCGIEKEIEP